MWNDIEYYSDIIYQVPVQAGEAARAYNRTGPPYETCTRRRWGQYAPPGPLGDRPIGWTRGPTSIQSSGPPRPVRAHHEIRSGRRPRRPTLIHHTAFTVVRNVRPSLPLSRSPPSRVPPPPRRTRVSRGDVARSHTAADSESAWCTYMRLSSCVPTPTRVL